MEWDGVGIEYSPDWIIGNSIFQILAEPKLNAELGSTAQMWCELVANRTLDDPNWKCWLIGNAGLVHIIVVHIIES
jgi:hypothetical protein